MDTAVLQRPTLVLNRHWQPVRVTTVARALVQVWNAAAQVVDPVDYQLYTWADWSALRPWEGEPAITTPRLRLRVPEVVTFTTYDYTVAITPLGDTFSGALPRLTTCVGERHGVDY